MKLALVLLLLLVSIPAASQTFMVSGRVVDGQTDSGLVAD